MRNFLGVWDDGYHNHHLYKRRSEGKWTMLPIDFDQELGGVPGGPWGAYAHPPASSFYLGEAGNGSNRLAAINRIKDTALKSFRAEFDQKLRDLAAGVLSPENVLATLDRAEARFDRVAWRESPAEKIRDPTRAWRPPAPGSGSGTCPALPRHPLACRRGRAVDQRAPAVGDGDDVLRGGRGLDVADAPGGHPEPLADGDEVGGRFGTAIDLHAVAHVEDLVHLGGGDPRVFQAAEDGGRREEGVLDVVQASGRTGGTWPGPHRCSGRSRRSRPPRAASMALTTGA